MPAPRRHLRLVAPPVVPRVLADADAAATRAEAAAKRARANADPTQAAKLKADAAVGTATGTAADAIDCSMRPHWSRISTVAQTEGRRRQVFDTMPLYRAHTGILSEKLILCCPGRCEADVAQGHLGVSTETT
ncbi:hypothetical protein GCM10010249_60910 [Streptomyces roseolilacinus]|uniref:Uncharacterized protein n=1 Tax=Streptomyces roseolilacinus TaxID=66904 RepID=A0A918B5X0_9ACTN|nr:hypothetical protein GCM10010249_60910 [Streptomyces roseolilacinus]